MRSMPCHSRSCCQHPVQRGRALLTTVQRHHSDAAVTPAWPSRTHRLRPARHRCELISTRAWGRRRNGRNGSSGDSGGDRNSRDSSSGGSGAPDHTGSGGRNGSEGSGTSSSGRGNDPSRDEQPGNVGIGPQPGDGEYAGTGEWRDLPGAEEWERWRRSWAEGVTDDSWAETTRDNKPKGFSGRRVDPIRGPRDAYLRPMIDNTGIRQRLAFKSQLGEDELRSEFEVNQAESRQAVSFAAFMFLVPLVTGFCVSRLVAEPAFYVMQQRMPLAFAPSNHQKVHGAEMVHKEELRIQMDVAIGRAPPLTDGQMQWRLRQEAKHLQEEFREENKQALLNVISDSITGIFIFGILATNNDGRNVLFRTTGRVFGGLSDTAKAFLIIASTDILLGYHSEEGWSAAIRLILSHYGTEVEEDASHIFVAIVPVVLDCIFKYWIFVGLNRRDPAATVTLKSMDRH